MQEQTIHIPNYLLGATTTADSSEELRDIEGNLIARVPADPITHRIGNILDYAVAAQERLRQTTIADRMDKLREIWGLLPDGELLTAVINVHGTPRQDLETELAHFKEWAIHPEHFFERVKPFAGNDWQRSFDSGRYTALGPTTLVLAGSMEIGEQWLVLSHYLLAGTHMIVRPSSRDLATPAFFQRMYEVGYSDGGQMVMFLSDTAGTITLNALIRQTPVSTLFSSDETRKRLTAGVEGEHRINGYGSGLPMVYVTSNANDLDHIAAQCGESAVFGHGKRCISTTPIFVHESKTSAFVDALVQHARTLRKGNPQEPYTDIGYFSSDEQAALGRMLEAYTFGFSCPYGYETLHGDGLLRDLLVVRADQQNPFLGHEIPAPVIAVMPYRDLSDAVVVANAALQQRGVAKYIRASVFGSGSDKRQVERELQAHLVTHNRGTTDFNCYEPHQGTFFMLDALEVRT
ncbi:aldehyde dehydrogenase [Candidatus Peregrinibacteria bacterium]|nr:aldehyde dehydrogenase [Candidatus Peregrinibacteria bacterium]